MPKDLPESLSVSLVFQTGLLMFLFKTNIFIPEDHLQSPGGRKISCVRHSPGTERDLQCLRTERDLQCLMKSSEGHYKMEGFLQKGR